MAHPSVTCAFVTSRLRCSDPARPASRLVRRRKRHVCCLPRPRRGRRPAALELVEAVKKERGGGPAAAEALARPEQRDLTRRAAELFEDRSSCARLARYAGELSA